MKHKPEQEQTVSLTQVGTLHGGLPGEFDLIEKPRRELAEMKEVLVWSTENVWSCTLCKSQHPQWIVNTDKFYYGDTLYKALHEAWKARD